MLKWLSHLKIDPSPVLLKSGNLAIAYFAERDLLEQEVPEINWVWQLPEVQKIFRKQQSNGSWKHTGKETVSYPKHYYSLIETWKNIYPLIERYEVNCQHAGIKRAAEFLFSCQTGQGDFRGMLANQYATYYTGAILALLIKMGYQNDPRVERGFEWLLSLRQNDSGWTIPILTHDFNGKTMHKLTSQNAEPIEPDKSKPFSHNWTDMVLRAFAVHPKYRNCSEARVAADLLKSRFFQPDVYSSYQDAGYWVRFLFWWPNIVTSLESLSLMGYSKDDVDVKIALNWLIENQSSDGLWKLSYVKGAKENSANAKTFERRLWLTLKICRVIKRFYD